MAALPVMEREPTSTTEVLKIDVDGVTHRGRRVVLRVSDTEIRQEIRFESLRQVDPEVYALREADFMRAMASEILWRLVAQWKAGGTRREKAEPASRRRRPRKGGTERRPAPPDGA